MKLTGGRAALGALLDLLACSRDKIQQIDSHGLHELLRPIADTLENGVEIQEAFFTEIREQEEAEEAVFQKLCKRLDTNEEEQRDAA